MLDATKFTVNQAELCEVLGVSRKTVKELEADGLPHAGDGRGKTYWLPDCFSWLRDRWDTGASVVSPALERFREARAKTAELDLEVRKKKFLPIATVAAFWAERVNEARVILQSAGQALGPQVVGLEAAQVKELVDSHLRRACERMNEDWMKALTD